MHYLVKTQKNYKLKDLIVQSDKGFRFYKKTLLIGLSYDQTSAADI